MKHFGDTSTILGELDLNGCRKASVPDKTMSYCRYSSTVTVKCGCQDLRWTGIGWIKVVSHRTISHYDIKLI